MSAIGILTRAPATAARTGTLGALLRRPAARAGVGLGLVLVLAAAVGPGALPDPDLPDYTDQLAAPGAAHWLGTDQAGRDLLARTLAGARASLGAALLVMAIAGVVGLVVGTVSGAVGGVVDTVLARVVDVLLGLPSLVLTLAVVGTLGPGFWNLVLAMAATSWAAIARLSRSVALGAGRRPDVLAARMAGVGRTRAVLTHVVPGVASRAAVLATLGLGEAVLALGGLSFLGLGAQPPTAEWGTMLATGRDTFAYAPWQIVGPGVGLVLAVTAVTLISDALRDATDPRRHT